MLDDGEGHGSVQRDRLHFEVCLWLSGLGDGAGHGSAQRDRLQFVVVGVKVGAAADNIGAFLSWVRWRWLAFISAIAAPKNLLRLGLGGVVVVGVVICRGAARYFAEKYFIRLVTHAHAFPVEGGGEAVTCCGVFGGVIACRGIVVSGNNLRGSCAAGMKFASALSASRRVAIVTSSLRSLSLLLKTALTMSLYP